MVSDKQRAFFNAKMAFEYIDRNPKLCKNAIRLNAGNTQRHEGFKFLICWQLIQEGKEFYTECKLKNGKIADILVLDDCKIIEILYSETLQEFQERKENYYPEAFEIVAVDATQKWSANLIY